MVAVVVEALELREGDRALDVGTGSGYQAAVMAACGAHVVSIERVGSLAQTAAERLRRLQYDVEVFEGDGTLGVPERAPFDAIAVGAGGPPRGCRWHSPANSSRVAGWWCRSPRTRAARSSPACGWSTGAGRPSHW